MSDLVDVATGDFVTAIELNRRHKISMSFKNRVRTDAHRKNLSIALKNRVMSDSWKKNMSLNHRRYQSEETKLKIKNSCKGKINLGLKSKSTKIKIGLANKGKIGYWSGKKLSIEAKKKMRLSKIKQIEKRIFMGSPIRIQIGKNEKQILDKVELDNNIKLERQFMFRGYFLDGYDKENNVVYEVDEKQHFDCLGNLKEKDIQRQSEIEHYLNCDFIRIKDGE